MEGVYCGIDLHANNSVVAVIDAEGKLVYRRRLENDLRRITAALAPYRAQLRGVVVESTFNWYWLVDGLMERGFLVKLANTTAIQQYGGLKHTDDDSDALWLAEMLRLGILPTGYIYPAAERGVRDLLRKRAHLVRQRTANILSIQNLVQRSTGAGLKSDTIKTLTVERLGAIMPHADVAQAMAASLAVVQCLGEQIAVLEKSVRGRVQLRPEFVQLKSIPGVGNILALTIMLETGEIGRFAAVGHFSSYCRCVDSKKLSNGKKKGAGNVKNGNRYLAWAFVEAANFAIRYAPPIQRFYQRKKARTNGVVAIKAVAHKLARASYYILRDQVGFDVSRAFC
jgi:transposase